MRQPLPDGGARDSLEPRLPVPLQRLRLFVQYRGQSLAIELERDTVSVHAMHCVAPSVRVVVNGETHHVAASKPAGSA